MMRLVCLVVVLCLPAGLCQGEAVAYMKVLPNLGVPSVFFPGAGNSTEGYDSWNVVLDYSFGTEVLVESSGTGGPGVGPTEQQDLVIVKHVDPATSHLGHANVTQMLLDRVWLHVTDPGLIKDPILKYGFGPCMIMSVEWIGMDEEGRPLEELRLRVAAFRGGVSIPPKSHGDPPTWSTWGWNFTTSSTSDLPDLDPPGYIPPVQPLGDLMSISSDPGGPGREGATLVAVREEEEAAVE